MEPSILLAREMLQNPLESSWHPWLHCSGTSHTATELFSDLVVTCTLNYTEPAGQDTLDNSSNQNGSFIFDELGLYTATGNLLTHIIFHPIQKSANRQIQVIYTVRVRAGAF